MAFSTGLLSSSVSITVCFSLQVFMVYKLKSTAFLPWHQLKFEFLDAVFDVLLGFLTPAAPGMSKTSASFDVWFWKAWRTFMFMASYVYAWYLYGANEI